MRWILPVLIDENRVNNFARELEVAPWVSRFLLRRGFEDAQSARAFLFPKLSGLSDPFLLAGMDGVVKRLLQAIDRKERVALYGDYDVDGVTSLAILVRVLRAYGTDVHTFLPHRIDEGYGLSAEGIARCRELHNPQLLVAVDCGTSSGDEIRKLQDEGIDVVVIDHHEPKAHRPPAHALLNPKLGNEYTYFCSAGLAFKVAHALLKTRPGAGFDLKEVLDLVAMGTVADIVPLIDENRILTRAGLSKLASTKWVGVKALIEVAGLKPPFSSRDVGFGLGPRLNAAGRLGTAEEALELLLTDDPARAATLAKDLDEQNRDRRQIEDHVCDLAESQLKTWFDPAKDAAIVVGDRGWHPGVVGIVASRILRKHHRPTFVIGFDEAGIGKGSGRSIEGVCLVTAIGQCGELLEKFGGHAMAAGLTMREEYFPRFRDAFRSIVRGAVSDEQLQPSLRLDAEMRLCDVPDALGWFDAFHPFGSSNALPVFYAKGVKPVSEPRLMKEKHLQFTFGQDGSTAKGVWWNSAQEKLPPPPWDIAFTIERNEWQGRVSPQLNLRALRTAV